MIRLNLFMIWFLYFLSLLSVICRYYRQNSSSRIIVVLVYTVSTLIFYQLLWGIGSTILVSNEEDYFNFSIYSAANCCLFTTPIS